MCGPRHALAARAVLRGAPPAGTGDAGLVQEAADGLAGDAQPFALAEELGEVLVVHGGVGGAGEPHDPLVEGVGQPPG